MLYNILDITLSRSLSIKWNISDTYTIHNISALFIALSTSIIILGSFYVLNLINLSSSVIIFIDVNAMRIKFAHSTYLSDFMKACGQDSKWVNKILFIGDWLSESTHLTGRRGLSCDWLEIIAFLLPIASSSLPHNRPLNHFIPNRSQCVACRSITFYSRPWQMYAKSKSSIDTHQFNYTTNFYALE